MSSKQETKALQNSIELGKRFNLVIGNPDPITPLKNFVPGFDSNRVFSGLVMVNFSLREESNFKRIVLTATRGKIETVGQLRALTLAELVQIRGISTGSAILLAEAFKQTSSNESN